MNTEISQETRGALLACASTLKLIENAKNCIGNIGSATTHIAGARRENVRETSRKGKETSPKTGEPVGRINDAEEEKLHQV